MDDASVLNKLRMVGDGPWVQEEIMATGRSGRNHGVIDGADASKFESFPDSFFRPWKAHFFECNDLILRQKSGREKTHPPFFFLFEKEEFWRRVAQWLTTVIRRREKYPRERRALTGSSNCTIKRPLFHKIANAWIITPFLSRSFSKFLSPSLNVFGFYLCFYSFSFSRVLLLFLCVFVCAYVHSLCVCARVCAFVQFFSFIYSELQESYIWIFR